MTIKRNAKDEREKIEREREREREYWIRVAKKN